MTLSKESCEACRPDAPLATESERNELMSQIRDWKIVPIEGVDQLHRVYQTGSYEAAVKLTNLIAEMAELMDHHPAILLEWGRVSVSWWSHKIKGLHRNDFICAARTDELFAELSS